MIIFLDGTYCSGKTKISNLLFDEDNSKYIIFHSDKCYEHYKKIKNEDELLGYPQNDPDFSDYLYKLIKETVSNNVADIIVDMSLTTENTAYKLLWLLADEGYEYRHIILCSEKETTFKRVENDKNHDKYTVESEYKKQMKFLKNNFSHNLFIYTDDKTEEETLHEVKKVLKKDYLDNYDYINLEIGNKIKCIINEFDLVGLNTEDSLRYLELNKDNIDDIYQKCITFRNNRLLPSRLRSSKNIEFKIKPVYDKEYYSSVFLMERANDIFFSPIDMRYHVSLNCNEIKNVSTLYFIQKDFIDWVLGPDDLAYVKENYPDIAIDDLFGIEFSYRRRDSIYCDKKAESENDYDIRCVLARQIRYKYQNYGKQLYDVIKAQGRINIKWRHEYELYTMFKATFKDAIFQYSPEWLYPQRFDIYIPQFNTAIEYQGEQHYKDVEYFHNLKENNRKDKLKRRIAKENGVAVLYWEYTKNTHDYIFREFLEQHPQLVHYPFDETAPDEFLYQRDFDLTPRIEYRNERKKVKKIVNKPVKPKIILSYIAQYSMEGDFIEKYEDISTACRNTNISHAQIYKAISGENKSAGGYIWKKYDVKENIPDKIEVRPKEITWQPVCVYNYENGKLIKKYNSITSAAKELGISTKTLRYRINKHPDEWRTEPLDNN